MAEEKEAATPESEKPAKQSNMGLILVIVVVSLVSSGGGALLSSHLIGKSLANLQMAAADESHSEEDKKAEALAEALEHGAVVPLEPFVVNLADHETARYLRIKISLMINDKGKLKEIEENQALTQKVRDVILQTLTKKTSQELINEEGKIKLRAEIQEQVGPYFKDPTLTDVMFTEFVIQL